MTLSNESFSSRLNLPELWQRLLTPCLPLLADECHLSILTAQFALPILLNAIHYQLIKTAHTPHALEKLLTQHFTKPTLVEKGVNFKQLSIIHPKITPLHTAFFNDIRSAWTLVGITSQRTHGHPQNIEQLTQYLTFFTLKSIIQLLTLTHTSLTQFTHWLPHSLCTHHPIDTVLLEAILIDKSIKNTAFFHLASSQRPSNFLEIHENILKQYLLSQPFAIIPVTDDNIKHPFLEETKTLPASSPAPLSNVSPVVDIFTPSSASQEPWHKTLQYHWIAFTIGLSALVIGGIGAIFTNHTPLPPENSVTKSADAPHDVAIIRTSANSGLLANIASAKTTTKMTSNKNKKPLEKNKPTNKKAVKKPSTLSAKYTVPSTQHKKMPTASHTTPSPPPSSTIKSIHKKHTSQSEEA